MKMLIWKSFTKWNSLFMCAIIDWFSICSWKYRSRLQYVEISWILLSISRIFKFDVVFLIEISETFSSRNFRLIKDMKIPEFAHNSWSALRDSKTFFTRAYWCSRNAKFLWFVWSCVEITIEIFTICFEIIFFTSCCHFECWSERRCLFNLLLK